MNMITLAAAFGLEEKHANAEAPTGILERAARYVVGDDRLLTLSSETRDINMASNAFGAPTTSSGSSGGTNQLASDSTTNVAATASNGGRRELDVATIPEGTHVRKISSTSRRPHTRSTSFPDNSDGTKKKPKPRRRTDGENVEDRLLRGWILKRAREAANLEKIRREEHAAADGARLTRAEIDRSTEALHHRAAESDAQRAKRQEAARSEAQRLAEASVSMSMSKKTREITSKMSDFSSRLEQYTSKATERAERRLEQAQAGRAARTEAENSSARVPLTKRAETMQRTLDDLQAWNERREAKIKLAKEEALQREFAGATFKPSLDPKSLRLALKKRMATTRDARRRGEARRVTETPSGTRAGQSPSPSSYQEFTPQINRRSSRIAASRTDANEPVYERLYGTALKSSKPGSIAASARKSPSERWGGYGVDDSFDDDEDSHDAVGFISLADVDDRVAARE